MLQLLFAQFVILYVEKCQEVRSAAEWELIAPSHEDSKSQLQGPIIYQPGTTRHRLVSFQTVHYMTCPRWLPSRQTWWFLRFLTVTGFCTLIQSIVFFFFFLPTSIPSPLYAQMQRAVSAAAASPHMSYAGGIAIAICFPNVMATPFQEL